MSDAVLHSSLDTSEIWLEEIPEACSETFLPLEERESQGESAERAGSDNKAMSTTEIEDENESPVIFTFTFDPCSEKRLEELHRVMSECEEDVMFLKRKVEILEDLLGGSLKTRKSLEQMRVQYEQHFDCLADKCEKQLQFLNIKDSILNEKENCLSKQLTRAVAEAVNALVRSGHLARTDTLMTDPLFKSQVEEVILRHLMQYGKLVDKVVERSLDLVDDMFNKELS